MLKWWCSSSSSVVSLPSHYTLLYIFPFVISISMNIEVLFQFIGYHCVYLLSLSVCHQLNFVYSRKFHSLVFHGIHLSEWMPRFDSLLQHRFNCLFSARIHGEAELRSNPITAYRSSGMGDRDGVSGVIR